jgi:hypothetical protein
MGAFVANREALTLRRVCSADPDDDLFPATDEAASYVEILRLDLRHSQIGRHNVQVDGGL